ncbi:two-component sensor histidine kinase [Amycolatopsis acidicola]|uniref:histidine kinase n=1 Tax=Amycolatopsis acidicola TaxID=2596893 RepID=A0A5N0UXD8_9PSEU|nr:histidine kinase [Amycolatopsis acidicola]KAA9158098.1 two-component sensor histidine kinase [Amycolatopsis acidicola]
MRQRSQVGGFYYDEFLRPFACVALVAAVAVQLVTKAPLFPAVTIPLFVLVGVLTLLSLFPGDRVSTGVTTALVAVYAVASGILLPLGVSTVAPAFAYLASGVAGERLASRRAAIVVGAVEAVVTAAAIWLVGELHPSDSGWPWWLGLTVAGPVYMGLARRDRRDSMVNAQRALRSEAREAALVERGRIAREIHDVLGHSLSGIALQLDMADALHGKSRDDEANQAVLRARRLAVDSITETRRAIEALRTDTLPLERTLELMCEGEAVPLRVDGDPAPVPTEAAHAIVRAAQEALTNAAKHASGAEREVTLSFTRDSVALTVANGPGGEAGAPGLSGGIGLVGMRERIALLGGTVQAGPRPDGGWSVELEVPR